MISCQIVGKVGEIVFARSKANAYNLEFMSAFDSAITEVESADDVRVVCVKSSISGFFCAGADIRDFVKNNIDDKRRLVRLANEVAARMQSSNKLYISAVNGHALGGGLEIMLATDIRLGSDSSYKLGMSEVALGLMPGNGGTQRFARIVGMPRALEYCISGAMITPQEAYSMGLLNQIFPIDGFDDSVSDYCQSIAKGAPLAIAAIKTAVYQGCSMPLCDGLELESTLADSLYDTDDADEGLSAFLEKRNAIYRGR